MYQPLSRLRERGETKDRMTPGGVRGSPKRRDQCRCVAHLTSAALDAMMDTPTLTTASSSLRVATRGSALALLQTELVIEALRAVVPRLEIELVAVRTTGDRNQSVPIATLGDGVF